MYNTGGNHRAGSKNAFGALAKMLARSLFSVGSVLPSSVAVARQGPFRWRRGVQLAAVAPSSAPGWGRGWAAAP